MEYDKSLDFFINNSISNNSNIRMSTSTNSNFGNIGEKARLFDQAVSEGMGISAKIKDGSFNNPAMQTGASNIMLNSGYYANDMITFRRQELTAIYHGCWVFRKIVDVFANDMWARGIEIDNEGDEQAKNLKDVYGMFNKVKSDMIYATEQARIYGGSAALMMVDDGEDDLSKPINYKAIKKGAKVNFLITDRWYGLEWSQEVVDDYTNPEFGRPKFYKFYLSGQSSEEGQWIHHSRVLRFVNRRSPRIIEQQLQGWGISELEHVLQDLMNHENTKNAIASLLNKALLEIIKLDGMRNTMNGLSAGNSQASQMFAAQMAALNNYRTSNKLVFMDKNDDYEKQEYSFSGLSDIMVSQKEIVCGAAEMPEVMVYGSNRAGLNGDKPVELRIYSNTVNGKQESECRPVVDKLLPVIFRCCGLEVPANLTYTFVSVLENSEESRQTALTSLITNLSTLLDNDLITHETAIKELQSASKQTGFGDKITQKDIDKAIKIDKEAEQSEGDNENGLENAENSLNEEGIEEGNKVSEKVSEGLSEVKKDSDYDEIKERIINATLRDKKLKRFKKK